jgi:hypothetical protein
MKELKELLIESLNYSNDLNMWFRSLSISQIEYVSDMTKSYTVSINEYFDGRYTWWLSLSDDKKQKIYNKYKSATPIKPITITNDSTDEEVDLWFRSLPNDEIEKIMNYDFSRSSKSTEESFLDAYRHWGRKGPQKCFSIAIKNQK